MKTTQMLNTIQSMNNAIHAYRLHIVILYVLLSYWFVISFSEISNSVILIILCFSAGCLGAYVLNRHTDIDQDQINEANLKVNKIKSLYISVVFLLSPVIILYVFDLNITPYVILLIFSLLYSYKIFYSRIKDIFFIKNIWAATGWYLSMLFIIMEYSNNPLAYSYLELVYRTWGIFFLFLFYELAWDMRDVAGDKISKTSTVPVRCGTHAGLFVSLLYFLIFYIYMLKYKDYIAVLAYSILLIIYLLAARNKSSVCFYHIMIWWQSIIIVGYLLF